MSPESTPVGVEFISGHIFQIRENKVEPIAAVIWKKSRIQHFRIGKDNVGTFPYSAPLRLHGISIINPSVDPSISEIFQNRLQRPVLVAGKGFGRVNKDRSGQRIL